MYAMQHMPQGPPPSSPQERNKEIIESLPDGLTCTEKVKGAVDTGCDLHADFSKLKFSCAIPKVTTITPKCCSTIQGTIDKSQEFMTPIKEHRQAAVMSKCQSYINFGMQQAAQANQIPADAAPEERFKMATEIMPAGVSCTQAISGGDVMSVYAKHAIISQIALAAAVGGHVSDEVNAMPLVASGIAGVLAGGLIVAGALFRYSKKHEDNQYSLLTAEAA